MANGFFLLQNTPAGQSTLMMNLQYMAVINSSQIVGHMQQNFIHRLCGIVLHERALSFAVRCVSYYWEKEERKRLTFRYNYYCGPIKYPVLIQDPAFILL